MALFFICGRGARGNESARNTTRLPLWIVRAEISVISVTFAGHPIVTRHDSLEGFLNQLGAKRFGAD